MWQITNVVQAAPPPPPSGDDRITMLLTAVGVIAAFGGIMLGIAALYMAYLAYRGKQDIEQEARKIAEDTARDEAGKVARQVAEEYLEKNETVSDMYRATVGDTEAMPDAATSKQSVEKKLPVVDVVPAEEEDASDGLE